MAKKRENTAPLEALRLVLHKHAIALKPFINQVSALPDDSQLEYYFVPVEHMETYRPYYRPGQPLKNLKLVNFERPAISLSFFSKHKYSLQRDVDAAQALEYLKNYRDELMNRSLFEQVSRAQQKELQQVDELLRKVRAAPNGYRFCLSNYHHYYRYWYCSYRYFEDEAKTEAASANEHLLKHTERIAGQVNQRLNIIFVDPAYISRPVPYDSKFVDRELETYPHRLTQGTVALYIKPWDGFVK